MLFRLTKLLVLLLIASPAMGQYISTAFNSGPGTQYPGWTYQQNNFATANGNGGNFGSCPNTTNGCQMGFMPTVGPGPWVMLVTTSNNVQIDGGCSGTNCAINATFQNGWVHCSNCHQTVGSFNVDWMYNTSGSAGTTAASVHVNGTPGTMFTIFYEGLPPSGFSATFNDSASTNNGGAVCASCTLAAPAITGTDMVLHVPVSVDTSCQIGPCPTNIFSSNPPFFQDFNGGLWGLNVTSSDTNPTYTQASGHFIDVAISFKATINFTANGDTRFYTLMQQINNQSLASNPSSTLSWTSNPAAGDLLFVAVGDGNSTYIQSMSETGGSSFTVPAGCQVAMSGTNANRLSCGYLTSSSSGHSSISLTMTGNSTIGITAWDIKPSSGTFTLDTGPFTAQDAACSICAGVTLTPTGIHGDVLFQFTFCPGGCNADTLYPNAANQGGNGMALTVNSSAVARLNTKDGTAISWGYTNNPTSVVGIGFSAQ